MARIIDLHEEWMRDEEYRREYLSLNEEFAEIRRSIEGASQVPAAQKKRRARANTKPDGDNHA